MLVIRAGRRIADAAIFGSVLGVFILIAVTVRISGRFKRRGYSKHRLIFAGKPITGLLNTGLALRRNGYDVWLVANDVNFIGEHADFDEVLVPESTRPAGFRTIFFAAGLIRVFGLALLQYDILNAYFNGGILGRSPLRRWEFWLWKLAGKNLVLLSYGSDGFIYSDLPDTLWAEAIRQTYPRTDHEDAIVAKRIHKCAKLSDAVIGCLVHWVNLPKLTANPLLWYPVKTMPLHGQVGAGGPVRIVHSPNHRRIKGTEYLIAAVSRLRNEGHDVELDVIENSPRSNVLEAIKDCDIVVDQLLMGYALSALEGMALGKLVITGVDLADPVYRPHHDTLERSPLIFASPDTIYDVLKDLIQHRASWPERAERIREYVETEHGEAKTVALFQEIYNNLSKR